MLFNSLSFFFYFIIVTFLYFVSPHRSRWAILLIASCYFYMSFIPIYILILFFTITIYYFAGIFIEDSQGKKRQRLLVLSICANIGVLALFKYYNFFSNNIKSVFDFLGWNCPIPYLSIILPIGLSFHTFQSLSYTIEVYRGNQNAERHFGIFALYVMFYPQLVAGPIERPRNLLHQFRDEHVFDYTRVTDGLKLMAWGLFKKVVVADRLALVVDQVYNQPMTYSGPILLLATVMFAFQIYCDFSGYSDMAIGAAQVMGFKLMDNFRLPYFSVSISEFWKRWHISLSTWFRDYLYIPLGGNRVSRARWQLNLLFVFLASGFWHGANWTFILWGALHGFYFLFSIWTYETRMKLALLFKLDRLPLLHKCLRILTTFALVSFAWIFFRAGSVSDALYIITHLFSGSSTGGFAELGLKPAIRAMAALTAIELVQLILQRYGGIRQILMKQPFGIRWAAYYVLVYYILMYGQFDAQQFIYFQF